MKSKYDYPWMLYIMSLVFLAGAMIFLLVFL